MPLMACALLVAPLAAEATQISIGLDTSALIGGTTAPYYIEFQFTNGDGLNNNSVTIGSFDFGGGSASGSPTLGGGVSGSLSSGLIMNDTLFFNYFYEAFIPGNFLSFMATISDNYVDPTPDQFSFAILNNSLIEVPTQGPGNEFVNVDLKSPLVINTFSGISGTDTDPVVGAPSVQTVPEPGTLLLMLVPLVMCFRKELAGRFTFLVWSSPIRLIAKEVIL